MGDRGNLGFHSGGETSDSVWLYTHWNGDQLPEMATTAIKAAQPRWDDPPYATRIALTALIGPIEGETGYGISTEPGDNEHDGIAIDWVNQKVLVIAYESIYLWNQMSEQERYEVIQSERRVPFDLIMEEPQPEPSYLRQVWDQSFYEKPGQLPVDPIPKPEPHES